MIFLIFGKNLSQFQIKKLISKNIKNVILIRDPDAIKECKKQSKELVKYFNVSIGFTKEIDLGDSTHTEILEVFENLKTVVNFNLNYVAKKQLL